MQIYHYFFSELSLYKMCFVVEWYNIKKDTRKHNTFDYNVLIITTFSIEDNVKKLISSWIQSHNVRKCVVTCLMWQWL